MIFSTFFYAFNNFGHIFEFILPIQFYGNIIDLEKILILVKCHIGGRWIKYLGIDLKFLLLILSEFNP